MTRREGFTAHLEEALANGIRYNAYWKRVMTLGWDPKKAATTPPKHDGRPPKANSIAALCRRHGIKPRRYYRVREELMDMEVYFTRDDIIDIVKTRQKSWQKS